jgi:hypothetical protein
LSGEILFLVIKFPKIKIIILNDIFLRIFEFLSLMPVEFSTHNRAKWASHMEKIYM